VRAAVETLAVLAAAVAIEARGGSVSGRSRRQLLCEALSLCQRDWADAVLAFEAAVDADPFGAGQRLYDWAMGPGWPPTHHPWMDRADING